MTKTRAGNKSSPLQQQRLHSSSATKTPNLLFSNKDPESPLQQQRPQISSSATKTPSLLFSNKDPKSPLQQQRPRFHSSATKTPNLLFSNKDPKNPLQHRDPVIKRRTRKHLPPHQPHPQRHRNNENFHQSGRRHPTPSPFLLITSTENHDDSQPTTSTSRTRPILKRTSSSPERKVFTYSPPPITSVKDLPEKGKMLAL